MRIAMVCLGNICRSPIAGVVVQHKAITAGLDVAVHSAGTSGWHIGKPMHHRSAAVLANAGYDPSAHIAQKIDAAWFETFDLILAMDYDNFDDLAAIAGPHAEKLRMFRSFDPDGPGAVPDPYYGPERDFLEVLDIVERTADVLIAQLVAGELVA